jgi:subtilisin
MELEGVGWTAALGNLGYNSIFHDSPVLRPLDLIASDASGSALIGSAARFLSCPERPPVAKVLGNGPSLRLDAVSTTLGKVILDRFVRECAGSFPDFPELHEAESMWLELQESHEEGITPKEVQYYLQDSAILPGNPVCREILTRNIELNAVLTTLWIHRIRFGMAKPVRMGLWHLRELLAPDIELDQGSSGEATITVSKPVLMAARCLRIIPSGRSWEIVASRPAGFDLRLWPGAILPPLTRGLHRRRIVPPLSRRSRWFWPSPGYLEYVVLPDQGVRVDRETSPRAAELFSQMHRLVREIPVSMPEHPELRLWVLHSISEFEPKRVRMLPASAAAVNALHLGFRLEPVLRYGQAACPSFEPKAIPGAQRLHLNVSCAKSGAPIQGAEVVAVVDWANQTGDSGVTDANGDVHLALGAPPLQTDRLYVKAPPRDFWGSYQTAVTLTAGYRITLQPVDLQIPDSTRTVYGSGSHARGSGVKVAVIDGGVGPHQDLSLAGGENVRSDESPADIHDWGDGHGTHVAGIIAGRGAAAGVAPGVELYSYRVYGAGGQLPDNYMLLHALILATREKCDIANLSVGMEQSRAPRDETLRRAIVDARDRGCVVIAAAGNAGQNQVTRLASYVSAEGLVVSAVGRRGTYPPGSLEESDVEPTVSGVDPDDFVAGFSNYSLDVSVTAPGVGVVSTVPNGGYRPLSGTSMAAPAIAGFAARIIEQNWPPLRSVRDRQRVTEILNRVVAAARSLGFPREREGSGMPR